VNSARIYNQEKNTFIGQHV